MEAESDAIEEAAHLEKMKAGIEMMAESETKDAWEKAYELNLTLTLTLTLTQRTRGREHTN